MSVNDRQKKNIDTKKKKKGFFPGNSVTWQSMNAGCTRGLCISNHSGDKTLETTWEVPTRLYLLLTLKINQVKSIFGQLGNVYRCHCSILLWAKKVE